MRQRTTWRTRAGQVSGTTVAVLASVAVALAGILALWKLGAEPRRSTETRPLNVFCAAALKSSVEAIAKQYEAEYGTPIQLQFGPSQTLLANIEVSKFGDLYLPADDSYLAVSRDKQLTAEHIPLARMHAVLVVPKGNPKRIHSLADLLASDAKLALANPQAAAITVLARRHLEAIGRWDALQARVAVQKGTVTEVAADVVVGAVDAAIVWDTTARDFAALEAVEDAELSHVTAAVAAGIVTTSKQPTEALRFARYLAASDRGLAEFARRGFQPIDGDPWEERPELVLYAGSMLRPAIEQTVVDFERREGVRVTRVYNGCGILVAEMKAGRLPDAYLACDREFMDQVKQDFPDSADLATNQLVILVTKGNPFQIRELADLSRENLRVGIGHEKQCAMGWLTQKTFREAKLTERLMKNVVVQTPTGDMLVNQLRAGSLDAAVAYLSNAVNAGDALDAIAIENLPCAIAVQPFGVAKGGKRRELTTRLFAALRSADSRQRFLDAGFQWGNQRDSANDRQPTPTSKPISSQEPGN